MIKRYRKTVDAARTFLGALRRDVAGNTFAIMAAAMIPLAGMVGSGIDISRMYITKTRLQHACDAGALAGRKQMGAGSWGTDDNAAAERFFKANYLVNADGTGYYGSTAISYGFTEAAGKVTGKASAELPMTLTRVIGRTKETLAVSCDAEMKLPNTDVMFVLDTTGSMNCVAGNTSCLNNGGVPANGSKIDGLKTAVKCFYEVLAQLDTDANCVTGTPSGGTSSAVQVRFGFVPYASNVNVGRLLPTSYFSDTWSYQSRQRFGNGTDWTQWQIYSLTSTNNNNKCNAAPANTASQQYRVTQGDFYGYTNVCNYEDRKQGPIWDYFSRPINTSLLKSGTGWNASFELPIDDDGSNRTIPWSGCIEERSNWGTNPASWTAQPTVNDIAQRPTSDPRTQWHQSLPKVVFLRSRLAFYITDTYASLTTNQPVRTAYNFYNSLNDNCPTEARLLQAWNDATVFDNYVDSLNADGNTYHDIGMLWGARLMWPGGIIDGNVTAANGGQIQRHMIFMTDGDSTSNPCDYNSLGVPWFDQRQTTDVGDAKDCGDKRPALVDQINTRLATLCTLVKNQGITLWVVSYGGTGIDAATKARLQTCASPKDSVTSTHYFDADDPDKLQKTFAVIANNISQLRLTN